MSIHLDIDEEQKIDIPDIRMVKDLEQMMKVVKEEMPDLPPFFEENRYGFRIKDEKVLVA